MSIARTVAGLVDSDDFTRADDTSPGGNWTTEGTSMTCAIVSNRLDLSGGGGSPTRPGCKMDGSGISRTEGFVQTIWRSEVISAQGPNMALFATGSRDGYSVAQNNTVMALQEWTAGGVANLSTPALAASNNTDYQAQLYVTDGVQQAFATGSAAATQTASATDASQNGVAKIPYLLRAGTSSSANSAIYDDFLWLKSKNIVVTGLTTGYKAKVINGGGSVVATATESSGTATIDCSRFGSATEFVPFAGWPKLRVTDGADSTIEEYTATAVYPGDEYTFTGGGGGGNGGTRTFIVMP